MLARGHHRAVGIDLPAHREGVGQRLRIDGHGAQREGPLAAEPGAQPFLGEAFGGWVVVGTARGGIVARPEQKQGGQRGSHHASVLWRSPPRVRPPHQALPSVVAARHAASGRDCLVPAGPDDVEPARPQ